MKNTLLTKRLVLVVTAAAIVSFGIQSAFAAENMHRLRIGLGQHSYEEKDATETLNVDQSSAVLGYTFGGEKWYTDVFIEGTPAKKGVGGDPNATIQFSQVALTIGRYFGDNISLFATVGSRGTEYTDRDNPSDDRTTITEGTATAAIGGAYSWFLGDSSAIGISLAAGTATSSLEAFKGDDKLASYDGNSATGFSLGLDFSSRITEHLGYALKVNAQTYNWKKYKTSQADTGVDTDVAFSRAHIYLFYDF